jgi:hypothetical protein
MRLRNVILGTAIAISGCKCGDEVMQPEISILVDRVSTSPQDGYVGTLVPTPPRVRVTSSPVGNTAGCAVEFEVVEGGGLLYSSVPVGTSSVTVFIDSDGYAALSGWRLGLTSGRNRLTANVQLCTGVLGTKLTVNSTEFIANALTPTPGALVKVRGDGQTAAVADTTPDRLKVRITGQQGAPVANQTVLFRVASGAGTIGGQTTATLTTDADGYAECPVWRMGQQVGLEVVEASSGTLMPVRFEILSQSAAPNRVVATTVPAGRPGVATAPVPEVRVTDVYGNDVDRAPVLFEVLAGGGYVPISAAQSPRYSTQTGPNGRAAPPSWILGTAPGLNQMRATVNRSGAPDPAVTGNPVMFEVTTVLDGTIIVRVSVYGAARQGVTVNLSGAATASRVTIADGSATFSSLAAGAYTVTVVPPAGTFFSPTSSAVNLSANQTVTVTFDGFGAAASPARPLR